VPTLLLAPAPAPPLPFLTPSEAAELLRLTTRTIRRWVSQGRLIAWRTHPGRGGRLLLRRADVLAAVGLADPEPAPPPAPSKRGVRR
jgi:excisionase family DNA binding protein